METFIEIMSGIGQVLLIIWNYIIGALTAAAQWIGEYFNAHILPSMPTMLKFFSDKTINMIIFCAVAAYILIINITAQDPCEKEGIQDKRAAAYAFMYLGRSDRRLYRYARVSPQDA